VQSVQPLYVETVIIGSGFSGLLAAIRLKKRGLNDFLLLERSPELGGTWQINTYPGAEVDVPTSLSPEPVTGFILSRTWFRLSDFNLLEATDFTSSFATDSAIAKSGPGPRPRETRAVR